MVRSALQRRQPVPLMRRCGPSEAVRLCARYPISSTDATLRERAYESVSVERIWPRSGWSASGLRRNTGCPLATSCARSPGSAATPWRNSCSITQPPSKSDVRAWNYESHAIGLDRNEVGSLLVAAGLGAANEHALISLLAINGLRISEALGADRRPWPRAWAPHPHDPAQGGKIVTVPPDFGQISCWADAAAPWWSRVRVWSPLVAGRVRGDADGSVAVDVDALWCGRARILA